MIRHDVIPAGHRADASPRSGGISDAGHDSAMAVSSSVGARGGPRSGMSGPGVMKCQFVVFRRVNHETDRSIFRVFFAAEPLFRRRIRRNPPFPVPEIMPNKNKVCIISQIASIGRPRGGGATAAPERRLWAGVMKCHDSSCFSVSGQIPDFNASPLPLGEGVRGRGPLTSAADLEPGIGARRTTPPLAPPPRGGGFERRLWGMCGDVMKCHVSSWPGIAAARDPLPGGPGYVHIMFYSRMSSPVVAVSRFDIAVRAAA